MFGPTKVYRTRAKFSDVVCCRRRTEVGGDGGKVNRGVMQVFPLPVFLCMYSRLAISSKLHCNKLIFTQITHRTKTFTSTLPTPAFVELLPGGICHLRTDSLFPLQS